LWEAGSESESALKSEAGSETVGPKMDPWRAIDAHNRGLEAVDKWCIADSHHFGVEQDQDADSHQNEKRDPDPQDP
jgi:hypothetical protein